jgi:putative oxidoreductase
VPQVHASERDLAPTKPEAAPQAPHANSEIVPMNLLGRASRLAISPLPTPTAWYAVPLRLIIGFGFMQHGYAKLARGPDDFVSLLHAMGIPFDFLLGWATIIVEIVGGLLVLLGALVPLATIPMVIVLLVAIFTVHLPNGFSSIKLQSFDAAGAHFGQPGYETDLLYLAGLIALCIGGAGPFSVDGILLRFHRCFQPAQNDNHHCSRHGEGEKADLTSPSRSRQRISGRQGRDGADPQRHRALAKEAQ